MRAQGIERPVNQITTIDDEKKTVYFVEALETNGVVETIPAMLRIIARIENYHKCKCVFRLHSDRAQ